MNGYCPKCNENVYPTMPHSCGDITYSQDTTLGCPNCAKLAAMRAVIEAARDYVRAEHEPNDGKAVFIRLQKALHDYDEAVKG